VCRYFFKWNTVNRYPIKTVKIATLEHSMVIAPRFTGLETANTGVGIL
jgi:hypothetical protein